MPLSTFSAEFVLARSSGVITSHNTPRSATASMQPVSRVKTHDRAGREDVAVELAVDAFELVHAGDRILAGANGHRLADFEGLGIGVVERRAAVGEQEVGSVVGQSPAVARVAHLPLELAGEVVDENLPVLPRQLHHLVVEDGEAFAEDLAALIRQRGHLAVERDGVELGRAADIAGALVEHAVAKLQPLREPDAAANDLAGDVELHERRVAANLRERLGRRAQRETMAAAVRSTPCARPRGRIVSFVRSRFWSKSGPSHGLPCSVLPHNATMKALWSRSSRGQAVVHHRRQRAGRRLSRPAAAGKRPSRRRRGAQRSRPPISAGCTSSASPATSSWSISSSGIQQCPARDRARAGRTRSTISPGKALSGPRSSSRSIPARSTRIGVAAHP